MIVSHQHYRASFVLVNNIPTPYRIHLFNALHLAFNRKGIAFEVWFMAHTEIGRYWQFDRESWEFPCHFYKGLHCSIRGRSFHFNPAMLLDCWRSSPTWLMLGGGWAYPSAAALAICTRALSPKTKVLLWSEANFRSSSSRSSSPTSLLRRYVYGRTDAYVVPGEVAETTLSHHWKVPPRPALHLPNIVDECLWRDSVARARRRRSELRSALGLSDDHRVIIIAARLVERLKGIRNFLQAAALVKNPNLRILVAGDGADRPVIERWLHETNYRQAVLLGNQSEASLVELLALSDSMALPSFRDPNPLTVIEALWAGLPIMLSRACGNWPETLVEGRNGWLIEPLDPPSIQRAIESFVSLPRDVLLQYGAASLEIAQQFQTDKVVDEFVARVDHL